MTGQGQSSGTNQQASQLGPVTPSAQRWVSCPIRGTPVLVSDSMPADVVIVISYDDEPMGAVEPSSLGGLDGKVVDVSDAPSPHPVRNLRWWESSDENLSSVHN